jgi:hypothetical protein
VTFPADEVLGAYAEPSKIPHEYLTLAFSPLSAPLCSRWRNNGLSADFLGDYVVTFLPRDSGEPNAKLRQGELQHAVTYVANELLENAMKYHAQDRDVPISIHLDLTGECLSICVSNSITAQQACCYRSFIAELLKGDPGELLIERLEQGARYDQPDASSCLGLLTMINDYSAQLGWRFHGDSADFLQVQTRVVLAL